MFFARWQWLREIDSDSYSVQARSRLGKSRSSGRSSTGLPQESELGPPGAGLLAATRNRDRQSQARRSGPAVPGPHLGRMSSTEAALAARRPGRLARARRNASSDTGPGGDGLA